MQGEMSRLHPSLQIFLSQMVTTSVKSSTAEKIWGQKKRGNRTNDLKGRDSPASDLQSGWRTLAVEGNRDVLKHLQILTVRLFLKLETANIATMHTTPQKETKRGSPNVLQGMRETRPLYISRFGGLLLLWVLIMILYTRMAVSSTCHRCENYALLLINTTSNWIMIWWLSLARAGRDSTWCTYIRRTEIRICSSP